MHWKSPTASQRMQAIGVSSPSPACDSTHRKFTASKCYHVVKLLWWHALLAINNRIHTFFSNRWFCVVKRVNFHLENSQGWLSCHASVNKLFTDCGICEVVEDIGHETIMDIQKNRGFLEPRLCCSLAPVVLVRVHAAWSLLYAAHFQTSPPEQN